MTRFSKLLVLLFGVLIASTEFMVRSRVHEQERAHYKYFWMGLATIIVGEVFSALDFKRVLCFPENHFLQGHAIWHLLAATGIYYIFLFYKQFRI